MRDFIEKYFPNMSKFTKWQIQEIGCFMLLVFFALIGFIIAILV